MNKSRWDSGLQPSVHRNGLKALLLLLFVGVLVGLLLIKPSGWGVLAGSAASPPQKMTKNLTDLSATPTPTELIPITEPFEQIPPLPDENSPEFPPLPTLEMGVNGMDELESAEERRDSNSLTELMPWYWSDFSQLPGYRSVCSLDLNKRSIVINYAFPFLKYSHRVPGQAWYYDLAWFWNSALGRWEHTGWKGPMTQIANYDSFIFTQKRYTSLQDILNPTTGEIGPSGGSHMRSLMPIGAGLNGQTYVAIYRYTVLSQVANPERVAYFSWVYFSNGSTLCGYDFSNLSRAEDLTDDGQLIEVTAPTPPPNSGSPNFAYLPMLRKPGTYNPAPTSTPFITPTAVAPPTPAAPPTTNTLDNPNFDQGPEVGWTEYSSQGYDVIMNGPKGFGARSGEYLAWLGGVHSDTSWISQSVTVPVSHPFLTMYLMASSQEDTCAYDTAVIKVDEYQVASIPLCKAQNFHSWLKNQIDLRDFAGQTVTLKVQVETDATLLSHLFVDDLVFESGVLIPTLAPTATQIPSDGLIRNPYFELGNNGDWGSYSVKGANNIFLNNGSHSGSWLAWMGGLHDEIAYIDQTITIPADRPYLNYWWWISSSETTCAGDLFWFIAGSDPVSGYYLCSPSNSTQWRHWYVDLSAYAGTAQRIRVQVQTNDSLLSSLYLDDFTFTASPPTSDLSNEPGGQFGEFEEGEGSPEGISPDGRFIETDPGTKESKP